MIVGEGLIANKFKPVDSNNLLLFASGVSNSRSENNLEFERELTLLADLSNSNPDKLLVYFSTYSIDDPLQCNTDYVLHKLKAEAIIKNRIGNYIIIRTSNVVGKTKNPFTITNFLFNKVRSSELFDCWVTAERNLLDVDDLVRMCLTLFSEGVKNKVVYLVNPISYPVPVIVSEFEKIVHKTANIKSVDKGVGFNFEITESIRLFKKLNITTTNYLERVLNKYYANEI